MARSRQDRESDFKEFFSAATNVFTDFSNNDSRAQDFKNIYMLNICPGSRLGGTNSRVVEVFWGSRPFQTTTQGRTWTALSEYGATLLYECTDNGFVIISLYPATTDKIKPIEDNIILDIWVDPIKLKDKSYLRSNWNDLMAYMECTSLDGNPTFIQKQHVSYLRIFKNLIVDKKWKPTKISVFVGEVLKWVLTVGLSGLIVYAITQWTQPTTTKTEIQLREINEKLETFSKQLDKNFSGNVDLKNISEKTDTIVIELKEVLKSMEKY